MCRVQMVREVFNSSTHHSTPLEASPLLFLQVVDPWGRPYVRLMAWWWSFMTQAGHREPQGPPRATQSHSGWHHWLCYPETGHRFWREVSCLTELSKNEEGWRLWFATTYCTLTLVQNTDVCFIRSQGYIWIDESNERFNKQGQKHFSFLFLVLYCFPHHSQSPSFSAQLTDPPRPL